jgi:hypothetical protein
MLPSILSCLMLAAVVLASFSSATTLPPILPTPHPMAMCMFFAKPFVVFLLLQLKRKLVVFFSMVSQEAVPIVTTLKEMSHQQPTTGTPLETDNSTAHDVLKAQVRIKRSKAFDMRCHWLKDCIARLQFNLCWVPGKHNRADYFTKHHPPSHHQIMRPNYLQRLVANVLTTHMRGCVAPPEHIHM